MPTETAIVVAGISLVFVAFIVALAWADRYTRNVRTPGAQYFGASEPADNWIRLSRFCGASILAEGSPVGV